MSQSSIDYLVNIVQSCIPPNYIPEEIIKQAKEMHKQEIEDAFDYGFVDGFDDGRYDDDPTYIDSTDYYNKTFKQ